METTTVTRRITIQAPVAEVWHAITDGETIRKYFFGTQVESEWKKGSPIVFSGMWKGKEYKNKGTVLDFIRNKFLALTHHHTPSGRQENHDNYYKVSYALDPERHDRTILTICQEGDMSSDIAGYLYKNWDRVLTKLKDVVEQDMVQSRRFVKKLFA